MKKIFIFIGSAMGKNSCTAQFAERILEIVKKKYDGELFFEIITADQVDIKPCKGCCNCFRHCVCPQDKHDDMAILRQKMQEADVILWGSPVYAHQVSGQMKIFIDRISYWLHLLILAGKPGIVLTTTASTGFFEVLSYLTKIMYYTGAKPVGGYNVYAKFQGSFLNADEVEEKSEKAAEVICNYLSGKKKLEANDLQETLFENLSKSIVQNKGEKPGEYEFWHKEGYFSYKSFQELLDKKLNRNRNRTI